MMSGAIKLIKGAVGHIRWIKRYYLRRVYYKYLDRLKTQSPAGAGSKILVINHHFNQDIEALLRGCSNDFEFFVVDCMPFFNEAQLYFKTYRERDGHIPYSELQAEITGHYRIACRRMFEELRQIFAFEAILVPSDSFWWIREFITVAREHGVKSVVLDKEGTISPYFFKVHSLQIKEKFPFISDNLLVWSERQKRFWMLAGAPEEAISVVGQPRSDFFFRSEQWFDRKKLGLDGYERHVLYFTFDIDAYINIFPLDEVKREGYSWLSLRNEINDIFFEFARENPTVIVTVKVHPQQADIEFMRNWVATCNLPNLSLVDGAAISNHLIVNADLIVGFQTTALIEAMLTNKAVIYAGWGITEVKLRSELVPFHETSGLEWVQSADELKLVLLRWRSGESVGGDLHQRKRFTDAWLLADGQVCTRVSSALKRIMNIETTL